MALFSVGLVRSPLPGQAQWATLLRSTTPHHPDLPVSPSPSPVPHHTRAVRAIAGRACSAIDHRVPQRPRAPCTYLSLPLKLAPNPCLFKPVLSFCFGSPPRVRAQIPPHSSSPKCQEPNHPRGNLLSHSNDQSRSPMSESSKKSLPPLHPMERTTPRCLFLGIEPPLTSLSVVWSCKSCCNPPPASAAVLTHFLRHRRALA
jgi:hypothetical protein